MFTRGILVTSCVAIALIALGCSGDDDDTSPELPGSSTLGELDASVSTDGAPKPDDGGILTDDDGGVVSSCITAADDPAAANPTLRTKNADARRGGSR